MQGPHTPPHHASRADAVYYITCEHPLPPPPALHTPPCLILSLCLTRLASPTHPTLPASPLADALELQTVQS